MKKQIILVIAGLIAAMSLAAYSEPQYSEATSVFLPSWHAEPHSAWFRFGEGRVSFGDYAGSFYEASNFQAHLMDYIDLMRGLNPVLLETVAVDSAEASNNVAFDGIVREDYLYMLTISCNYYFFRMIVHEAPDFGLLHFNIHGWETTEVHGGTHMTVRGLRYHSLYRISLEELERIIQFANGLERTQRLWEATPVPRLID